MATQTITTQHMFAAKPSTASPPTTRIRAYKDFLTPALHRRFTTTAGVVFLVCIFEAWQLSNTRHLIWSWFPLGSAGLRALLLSISCLAVFIVRVANMHIGQRIAPSAAQETLKKLSGGKVITTAVWYIFSAWWFGEVYIWSRNETAELGMVDPGRAYERPRLNENPIFLRALFVVTGVVQVFLHLLRDYDQIRIPMGDEKQDMSKSWLIRIAGVSATTLSRLPRPFRALALHSGQILGRTCNALCYAHFLNLILYFGFVRHRVWGWTYAFARTWFSNLPEGAGPTGISHFWKILPQALFAPFLMLLLWEASNVVFSTSVAQPPLRKENPLTSEIKDSQGVILHKSADPNGSLLSGLKAKKDLPKTFAFWELFIICEQFEMRRKTLYSEVDRKDGSTWSKICELTLKEISAISDRVKTAQEGPEYKKKLAEMEAQKQHHQHLIAHQPEEETGLKRIADRTVNNDADVFAKQKPDLANAVNNWAKSIGMSPNSQDPVSPRAKKYLQWAAKETLTPHQQQYLTPGYLQAEATGIVGQFLKTPTGEPFRQTFARNVASVVLDSPTSNQANIIHAAKSLAKLCVCSLKEDNFGQVQKDVVKIIRTFTTTIKDIEMFVKELKPHWTDVNFNEAIDRTVYDPWTLQTIENPEAVADVAQRFVRTGRIARFTPEKKEFSQVMDVLKASLEEILLAFQEYAGALGLTKKDTREAKEAIQKPPPPPLGVHWPQPTQSSPSRPEMEEVGGEEPHLNGKRQRRTRYN
ncbi:Nucleoporin NDC1 [Lecanosticta acicola]|uniref:Nucleoporin NDC1 n=1 Tax=Lecanosticta acicola TaxID=111012 RepID=A0AAI8Z5Z8_9PEZI|nr:Nucleoporin NDC1 [Lecanosticta acicola]